MSMLLQIVNDVSSTCPELLTKASLKTLEDKRKYNMMVTQHEQMYLVMFANVANMKQTKSERMWHLSCLL